MPTSGGSSSIPSSSTLSMSAMSTSPAVLSRGGNLASSSSNPNRELEPGSVTSGEGTLIPSSLQIDVLNRKACLESDDQMPLPMSTDLLGFPSPSDWKVANQKVQERIDSSNVVNIYNILEWLVVYTNSLRNFQFLGHWHGPDDIYNVAGHSPKHSSRPPPLISPTDFTIVPHTFNQFQPCDSVYDRVNGVRRLSYPYYNKCRKFFQTSKALYKGGWKLLGLAGERVTMAESASRASYILPDVCCINKLVETFKADAPSSAVDDRIIGAVFGNSVGDKETVWREELE
ncbi:hypothetical protein BS47DRAFT_1359170 [Hydnum rufescens UP504]|uniref:Uncharacterized protein n=1 Tax=Hydnum rufescens UP504 TaxID=1448309 RepID=A0A9P6B5Y1_9AGAM|nr:hypothetical protein BS47DRAFT_1359170 [Hydnum rufescens UP504]